jgi:hypothetical protein
MILTQSTKEATMGDGRMTRAEHMRWCKKRAHESYQYDITHGADWEKAKANVIGSMLSDLGKHPETEILVQTAFMISMTVRDEKSLWYFVDGFAE